MEPEMSLHIMMSMPLASTRWKLLPLRGCARPRMSSASPKKKRLERKLPAFDSVSLPSARNGSVEEKTMAGEPPRCPRSQERRGMRSSASRNHGCAKNSPESLNKFTRLPFHEPDRLLEKLFALAPARVDAGELDEVGRFQEFLQQRSLLPGKGRGTRDVSEEFRGCPPGRGKVELLGNITAQHIGNEDAERVRVHFADLPPGVFQRGEGDRARGGGFGRGAVFHPAANKQAEQNENAQRRDAGQDDDPERVREKIDRGRYVPELVRRRVHAVLNLSRRSRWRKNDRNGGR